MGYQEITETLEQVSKRFGKDLKMMSDIIRARDLDTKLSQQGYNVGARDFLPILVIRGVQGNTPDERKAYFEQELDKITKAFSTPDFSQREPYLNSLFDFWNSFDPENVNMKEPEQVEKLLQYTISSQTFVMKLIENPDYYNRKYPTSKDQMIADCRQIYSSTVSARVKSNLEKELGVTLDTILTLPYAFEKEHLPFQTCREKFALNELNKALEAENSVGTEIYEMPIPDQMISFSQKKISDVKMFSEAEKEAANNYYALCLENNLLFKGRKNMQGLEEAQMFNYQSLYIDGKPVDQFCIEHNLTPGGGADCHGVIATALLNGNPKVDIVHSYRDEQGNLQFAAKTLKAVVTPEQERLHLEQYSWFRRTFLNWWPFRIEGLQEKIDRMANDPKKEARHKKICANQKEAIITNIEKVQKEAAEAARKKEEESKRFQARQKEENRLEHSVEQWEKDSVMGILGQQMKGSYKTIRLGLMGGGSPKRYAKISTIFAKQVLYTKLCQERVTCKEGEIGTIETQLRGDGSPDTIKKNIEETAKQMAQSKTFEDLVHEKLDAPTRKGKELDLTKFQELLANGGCVAFTKEYLEREKQAANHQPKNPTVLETTKTMKQEGPKRLNSM